MASRFSLPLRNSHCQALPGRHLAAGGGLPTHCKRSNKNSNSRPTILALIHPYHTSVSLPLPPNPLPHGTPCPSVSWWSTMSYDRPSSWNSSRFLSLQPAFFHWRSRWGPGLAPIIHRVFSTSLWTWRFCPLPRAARRGSIRNV